MLRLMLMRLMGRKECDVNEGNRPHWPDVEDGAEFLAGRMGSGPRLCWDHYRRMGPNFGLAGVPGAGGEGAGVGDE
jgi:hypothetical protein